MCTVLFAFQAVADAPVVLGANRDELRSRPSDPPLRLLDEPEVWGGRDRLAGGTWLAVDPSGRVCAVTNRHPGGRIPARDGGRRSRGGLPLDVLRLGSDDAIEQFLASIRAAEYNPVNVLYLSRVTALWAGVDDEGGVRMRRLPPGIHVLTEQDPDDPDSPKATELLVRARRAGRGSSGAATLLAAMQQILRSHDRTGRSAASAACIHEKRYGTVSSATVVVGRDRVRFRHAEGPPCQTDYLDVLDTG